MSNDIINTIIEKYKPIVYFHKDEKYFPCDADYFVKNSHLINKNKVVDSVMNQTKLYHLKEDKDTFIQPFNSDVIFGYIHNYQDAPLYYYVRDDTQLNKLYIYFFLFFSYNGSYNILNISDVGQHYSDVEHFTYEINKTSGELERIFFSAHGSDEGIWKYNKDIEFVNENGNKRPVLYCAKHGHGFYPKSGCAVRFFGFANDLTNKGYKYDNYNMLRILKPENKDFDTEKYGWFYSNVKFGFDGTTQIYKRNYLLHEDKGKSIQIFVPESIYDFAPNITYLLVIIFIMWLLKKFLKINNKYKRIMFIVTVYIMFMIVLKMLKETVSKL